MATKREYGKLARTVKKPKIKKKPVKKTGGKKRK